MNQTPVIVIAGPTASGKTGVAVELALQSTGEVISADSRQIYRMMDIATAKPSESELRGVPHYGFDIAEPDEVFSAGRFAKMARGWIQEIRAHGRTAIVAGGSGLYLQALIDGFFSGEDIKDPDVRRELEQEADMQGLQPLYDELQTVDPDYAAKTLPADRQRILRALEVYRASGIRFSELHERKRDPAPWPVRQFALDWPRDVLYERIDLRVERMVEQGLIIETRDLLDRGYRDAYAMKSVGYREAVAYLDGDISLAEMIELIQRNTRQYAKRQLTWFRRDDRIEWIDCAGLIVSQIAETVLARL